MSKKFGLEITYINRFMLKKAIGSDTYGSRCRNREVR